MNFLVLFLALLCGINAKPMGKQAICGSPAIEPDVSQNIVGGKEAIPYSWPWQVALARFGGQFCGGTLISNEWIVTAGHCFYGVTSVKGYSVRLGVFDKTKQDEPGEVILDIKEIHVHPKYNPLTVEYDITLLRLEKPVEFTDHISPACIPATQYEELPDPGTPIFVTGWGDTATRNVSNEKLLQISEPTVSDENCKKVWKTKFHENVMFCGGYEEGGKGPCYGDSGGPVVFQDPTIEGRWKLLGIVSWGPGICAIPKYYAVYSKVPAYVDFIHEYVKDLPV